MENTNRKSIVVSIIIPLYNAQNYIEETIKSVLKQTYKKWELLIIDDCSTDESFILAEKFTKIDNRITVYKLFKNSGGPAAPRNKGISNAQGEYIAFLDADDIWHEQKLEKQIDFLNKNDRGFTSCDYYPINKNSEILKKSWLNRLRHKRKTKKTLLDVIKSNFIVTSSVLIKKQYLEKFDIHKEFIAVEDLCMWLNIFFKHEKIYQYQDIPMVGYRILSDSISNVEGSNRQNIKINYCLYAFLLQNNLSKFLPILNMSICKNRIGSLMTKVFKR